MCHVANLDFILNVTTKAIQEDCSETEAERMTTEFSNVNPESFESERGCLRFGLEKKKRE